MVNKVAPTKATLTYPPVDNCIARLMKGNLDPGNHNVRHTNDFSRLLRALLDIGEQDETSTTNPIRNQGGENWQIRNQPQNVPLSQNPTSFTRQCP